MQTAHRDVHTRVGVLGARELVELVLLRRVVDRDRAHAGVDGESIELSDGDVGRREAVVEVRRDLVHVLRNRSM